VAVDEEDSADVKDFVVAELVGRQAEELPHHSQHRRLVLVKSEIEATNLKINNTLPRIVR
jgi:hypothetical protein